MWEYMRIVRNCLKPEEMVEQLNHWGRKGWEVIKYEEKKTAPGNKKHESWYFALLKKRIDS
jgi:hypothetical protein